MEIFKQTNFDFLGRKWPFIWLSLALTLAGVISLALKGGPKYGIDFTGGALMDVNFAKRPSAEAIRSAIHKKIPGEIEVQEVSNSQEVLISASLRNNDQGSLQNFRGDMVSILNTAFNPPPTGKLDINTATPSDLADNLRDALAKASVPMSDDQLQTLTKNILNFRDTPPRSGLIRNIGDLSSVPGVTPKVLGVLEQQCFPGNFAAWRTEVVGPKIGLRPATAGHQRCIVSSSRDVGIHRISV